jgi:hypothetical protein
MIARDFIGAQLDRYWGELSTEPDELQVHGGTVIRSWSRPSKVPRWRIEQESGMISVEGVARNVERVPQENCPCACRKVGKIRLSDEMPIRHGVAGGQEERRPTKSRTTGADSWAEACGWKAHRILLP